jgi:hypothetical protein
VQIAKGRQSGEGFGRPRWYRLCVQGHVAHTLLHAHDDVRATGLYRAIVRNLTEAGIPFLVGGTYALEYHADLLRDTKDFDLFVRRADWPRIERALTHEGFQSELVYTHWLGKVRDNGYFVDIIFAGGNGLAMVDDDWLAAGVPALVLDLAVHLVAAEDMIWSKAFVMERERYDGGDVAHILRKCARTLDWGRLLRCFGANAPVLLSHLVLFQFAYPDHRNTLPDWVLEELWHRGQKEPSLPDHLCRGTLLSREQYLVDVKTWGYLDARETPVGYMTPQQIQEWTAAISDSK